MGEPPRGCGRASPPAFPASVKRSSLAVEACGAAVASAPETADGDTEATVQSNATDDGAPAPAAGGSGERCISSDAQGRPLAARNREANPPLSPSFKQRSIIR